MKSSTKFISIVILLVGIILVNLIASMAKNARIDTTSEKIFTLTEGTKEILKTIEGDIEVDYHHTVEDVGIFKPAPQVYELVEQQMGCARDEVLFVSSNGWDAACATGFGFTTAWVNRAGDPMDRLPWTPAHSLSDLTTIPEIAN